MENTEKRAKKYVKKTKPKNFNMNFSLADQREIIMSIGISKEIFSLN